METQQVAPAVGDYIDTGPMTSTTVAAWTATYQDGTFTVHAHNASTYQVKRLEGADTELWNAWYAVDSNGNRFEEDEGEE